MIFIIIVVLVLVVIRYVPPDWPERLVKRMALDGVIFWGILIPVLVGISAFVIFYLW